MSAVQCPGCGGALWHLDDICACGKARAAARRDVYVPPPTVDEADRMLAAAGDAMAARRVLERLYAGPRP